MRAVRPRLRSRSLLPVVPLLIALGGLLAAGCGSRDGRRVLVIGLDGATFTVIDPLIREGVLPNLAALQKRGRQGTLESVLPVESPPAWTSAITGVNPGKHNIFDFFHSTAGGPEALLTSSLDRRAHPVWYFLNEAGRRTGIMNIPMTFPPDKVDGFFISGFPYGRAKTGFTYPPELEKSLGDYPLDLFGESLPPGREGMLLDRFRYTLQRQSEEALRLMKEKDWNLFWVVFTGTDKVQHFFWKFSDPKNPEYDPAMAARFGDAIRDFWIRADRVVGQLVAEAGPDTDVLVVSDHGFGPIYRELRLSSWLREEGFVEPGQGSERSRAEALAPGAFGGLVRANVKGRDFDGAVAPSEAPEVLSKIKTDLQDLKDPVTGDPFIQKVLTRDEAYSGPYVDNAPDLVFLETPGRFIGRGKDPSAAVFGLPSYTFSAFHRPEGILIAAGPHFPPDPERRDYSILDLAPTIYWLFDVEAPNDLDGQVPPELVGADSLAARALRVGDESAVIPPRDVPVGGDGDREVLESLGYVQ